MAAIVLMFLLWSFAPDALVVVGENAPPQERAAAQRLARILRSAGGPEDNLVFAEELNADLEKAARHHLFVVGTTKSNRVLERVPSHWTLNRDAFYAKHEPYEEYMPTTGYYAAGFGTFKDQAVGYIECDRNPYWSYATNFLNDLKNRQKDYTPPELPYRQIIRLTGNSPEGVALAVKAFIEKGILTGAVTAEGKLPGEMSLWTLDTAHYALPSEAPDWIPENAIEIEKQELAFAGWQLADSFIYSGFLEAADVPAEKIWRAKYITEKGVDYPLNVVIDPAHPMTRSPLFEASLARRASGNEFFVAKLATAADAQKALENIQETLNNRRDHSHKPWKTVQIEDCTWQKSRFGFHIGTKDDYLIMESFDGIYDDMAMFLISKGISEAAEVTK